MAEPDTKTEAARKTALRAAYTAATSRLRTEHQEEFNLMYSEEAKARGVEWRPRPTTSEKARTELAALLSEHPELFEEIDALRAVGLPLAPRPKGDPTA